MEVSHIGFDKNHVHFLGNFLPKYSGGQIIRLLKSITAREVFKEATEIKRKLWGGEFWADGYYFRKSLSYYKSRNHILNKYYYI